MPKSVLDAAVSYGGVRKQVPDEDLCSLYIKFEDEAYKEVDMWVANMAIGDPMVNVAFAPPMNSMSPPMESVGQILTEACSIANYYAPLKADDFSPIFPVNPLPGPLPAPINQILVRHAKKSLHALHARIQNLNDPNYPLISSLPTGSYICSVLTRWPNVIVAVAIYKS